MRRQMRQTNLKIFLLVSGLSTMRIVRVLSFFVAGLLLSGCHYDFGVTHTEKNCNDGLDNDGDGRTDCNDLDCAGVESCLGELFCDDGLDNDEDGLTDCDDPDCIEDCRESACDDGLDNDEDGATDCDDSDCTDALACLDHACNENQVCEAPYEDRRWCADCLPNCSLDQGQPTEYIVTALTVPHDSTEAKTMGVDLDGDGDIDNNLGGLLGLASIGQQDDTDTSIAEKIQNGSYIMLVRILADQWPHDDVVAVQIFDGDTDPTHDATEDNLTGQGDVLISSTAPRTDMMCGSLSSPSLVAGPGQTRLPLPLFRRTLYITTTAAWVITGNNGSATQDGLTDVIVAGGWTKETVDYELAPEIAHYLSTRYIEEGPGSAIAENIDSQVDGHCTNIIPGCEDVVNGEGECVKWDGDPTTPVVSATEVRCSALATYLQPTVDLDGDGKADVFPVGIRISAVPVHIRN